MQDLSDDERVALEAAAGAMARYWRECGLVDAVRAIGRERGLEGTMVFLSEYFETLRRQRDARDPLDDEIPF